MDPTETAMREDARTRIRRALIDLCYERGLASLELPDLQARAGVDAATFGRHFADLEDCFFKVYSEELDRFRRESAAARAGFMSWRDRVRATAYALYRFLAADERIRWLTSVEVRSASERSQLAIGGEITALFDLIDEGRDEPEARTNTILDRPTAEAIGGGIFTQILATASQRGRMPTEAVIVPELMFIVIGPYLGEDKARAELTMPASDHRRSPVFGALIELGDERGIAAIPIADLVSRSGIERAEFERRFGDVEGCFAQLLEAERAILFPRLERARAGCGSWRDRLRATAHELLVHLGEDRRVAKLLSVDIRIEDERVRSQGSAVFDRFAAYVDEGRYELPAERRPSPELAATVTDALVRQLGSRIGEGGPVPAPADIVPELMYSAILPYCGEEVARQELAIVSPGRR